MVSAGASAIEELQIPPRPYIGLGNDVVSREAHVVVTARLQLPEFVVVDERSLQSDRMRFTRSI
jgi:hypothetical protein